MGCRSRSPNSRFGLCTHGLTPGRWVHRSPRTNAAITCWRMRRSSEAAVKGRSLRRAPKASKKHHTPPKYRRRRRRRRRRNRRPSSRTKKNTPPPQKKKKQTRTRKPPLKKHRTRQTKRNPTEDFEVFFAPDDFEAEESYEVGGNEGMDCLLS